MIRLLVLTLLIAGCAHRQDYQTMEAKVAAMEVADVTEVREDLDGVLAAHPKIDPNVKEKIRSLIHTHLDSHTALKAQEAKYIHLLLSETLQSDAKTPRQFASEKLNTLYSQKSANIQKLITELRKICENIPEREAFYKEMEYIMREIR
jgi:hypothetical protein